MKAGFLRLTGSMAPSRRWGKTPAVGGAGVYVISPVQQLNTIHGRVVAPVGLTSALFVDEAGFDPTPVLSAVYLADQINQRRKDNEI